MKQGKKITAGLGSLRALRRLALRYGRKARVVDALRAEARRRAA